MIVSIEMIQLTEDPWKEFPIPPFPVLKIPPKIPLTRLPLLTPELTNQLQKLLPKTVQPQK
jgi:hypothetical protein